VAERVIHMIDPAHNLKVIEYLRLLLLMCSHCGVEVTDRIHMIDPAHTLKVRVLVQWTTQSHYIEYFFFRECAVSQHMIHPAHIL
jgi:hypothetical protein